MLVLAGQASLTLYLGEDGLVLALVGEGHTGTRTLAGMEHLPLTWDTAFHTTAWAAPLPMGIHIDIYELHSLMDKVEITEIDCSCGRR